MSNPHARKQMRDAHNCRHVLQVSVGETLLTGVATATAMHLAALPTPPQLQVLRNLEVGAHNHCCPLQLCSGLLAIATRYLVCRFWMGRISNYLRYTVSLSQSAPPTNRFSTQQRSGYTPDLLALEGWLHRCADACANAGQASICPLRDDGFGRRRNSTRQCLFWCVSTFVKASLASLIHRTSPIELSEWRFLAVHHPYPPFPSMERIVAI